MRLKLLFSESVRSLGANLSTTIAATMTVLIGMFLLGLFIALGSWAQAFGDHQKEKLLVKVYFCTESTCKSEATDKQINAVRDEAGLGSARQGRALGPEGGGARADAEVAARDRREPAREPASRRVRGDAGRRGAREGDRPQSARADAAARDREDQRRRGRLRPGSHRRKGALDRLPARDDRAPDLVDKHAKRSAATCARRRCRPASRRSTTAAPSPTASSPSHTCSRPPSSSRRSCS